MDVRENHEIYQHKCEEPGCGTMVMHNNSPYCAQHTEAHPEGIPGYSAKDQVKNPNLTTTEVKEITESTGPARRNIFE